MNEERLKHTYPVIYCVPTQHFLPREDNNYKAEKVMNHKAPFLSQPLKHTTV
jgi:hypothetical protein